MVSDKTETKTAESLDALTGGMEHLEFATDVVARTNLPSTLRQSISDRIEQIRARRVDSSLYMAVIGEFSSGKSTFINAVLRDDLLKANALVTTAAATRLRHGLALEVEAEFAEPQLGKLKVDAGAPNLREFIHSVTSDPTVAPRVSSVTITHPARFLSGGIVVIDTPGTNAIDEDHARITTRVVEHEADAAIIMIPAIFPLSQTLLAFLFGRLKACLHRCVFVVTRIDQVREAERDDLLANVRQRLEAELSVRDAVLHACSAQAVMDALGSDSAVVENGATWTARFSELEHAIYERLQRERTLSIAERIVRLLTQLFDSLEGHLKDRRAEVERRRVLLQKEIVQDLASFTREQHTACRTMFAGHLANVRVAVDDEIARFRQELRDSARSTVYSVSDLSEFDGLQEQLEEVLEDAQDTFSRNLADAFARVGTAATAIGKAFDEKFTAQYRRLVTLGAVPGADPAELALPGATLDADDVLTTAMNTNKELAGKTEGLAGGFGLAGAAMGTMFFPVIGTAVGWFVGAVVGVLFAPSLDTRKQKIWQELDSSLDEFFDDTESQAEAAFETIQAAALNTLDRRIDLYIARYQTVVEALVRKQQTEIADLARLQQTVEADLKEINRRRVALVAQQKRLASH